MTGLMALAALYAILQGFSLYRASGYSFYLGLRTLTGVALLGAALLFFQPELFPLTPRVANNLAGLLSLLAFPVTSLLQSWYERRSRESDPARWRAWQHRHDETPLLQSLLLRYGPRQR